MFLARSLFHSIPGGVFPVYHVFRAIAELPGASTLPVSSTDPLAIVALGMSSAAQTRLIVANLTPTPRRFRVDTPRAADGNIRTLDATTAHSAATDPDAWLAGSRAIDPTASLELLPFAVAVLDHRLVTDA
jgi:hypothetical protein